MASPTIQRNDDLLRELWATDLSCTEIGKRFGASRNWASERAHAIGLPRRSTDMTKFPGAMAEAAYVDHGMTLEEIVEQMRDRFPTLSRGTVRRRLAERGVAIRSATARHQDLTAACVRLRRAGLEYPEIAKRLGLTKGQVGNRCRKVLGVGLRGKFSKVDVAALLAFRKRGLTLRAIAALVGLKGSSTVCYHLRRARRSA